MSRDFDKDDTGGQGLWIQSTPVTIAPFTIAAWFNVLDLTNNYCLFGLADRSSTYDYFYVGLRGAISDKVFGVANRSTGTNTLVETSTTYTANTWHHACWTVNVDSAHYYVWLDGGGMGSVNRGELPLNIDSIGIGLLVRAADTLYMDGMIAEAALWNVEITPAEAAILGAGYSPLFVRPQSLVGHWPMIRGLPGDALTDIDVVGGRTLSKFRNAPTPGVSHPPMIYPGMMSSLVTGSGAGPSSPYGPLVQVI